MLYVGVSAGVLDLHSSRMWDFVSRPGGSLAIGGQRFNIPFHLWISGFVRSLAVSQVGNTIHSGTS